jgi:hypothetical protein
MVLDGLVKNPGWSLRGARRRGNPLGDSKGYEIAALRSQ